ncbi:MAG: hydrogenase maturation nickel metallochaperone HypA [Chryseobacterium sp.]|nr:MAG: hydrogenase maturation nickel metallochaperone HypA [Chryseobacterium sp.]
MHELSIATSILKTVEQEVEKIKGGRVADIYLEIGKISGVEITSLQFVWPLAMKSSVLEHSKVHIEEPEGYAKCAECGNQFYIDKIFDNCPQCKSPFKEVLKGKEMKIRKLVII